MIAILCPAADAVPGVGQHRFLLLPCRSVQPVPDHRVRHISCKRASQRVVGIQAQYASGRCEDALSDFVQCMHDLSVSVQLIAEQIGHDDHLRRYQRCYLFQGAFITLDHGVMCLRLPGPCGIAGKLRSDSGQQVGPGFVGQAFPPAGAKRIFQHTAGRGLAIGPGDHYDLHSFADALQYVRVKQPGCLSRQSGPPAVKQS